MFINFFKSQPAKKLDKKKKKCLECFPVIKDETAIGNIFFS